MKKSKNQKSNVLFITLLILFSMMINFSYAQKSKKVEIYKNNLFKDYMDVNYYYDSNNTLTSTQISLYGQDLRYKQIVELVTIYSGSPKEIFKFFNDVEKFANENEPDVSTTINGIRINIVKESGFKGFYIYEKDGSGYRGYNMKTWGKIKKALITWADKNNETLE